MLLAIVLGARAASSAVSADAPTSHADFFWEEYAPAPNSAVHFHGTGSSDTNGVTPTAYHWDFGDGGTATGADPAHSFAHDGSFDVTLTVDFSDDTTGSSTQTLT